MISPAAAIQELRRDFASRGWCRKATSRVLLDLLLDLGMAAAGAAVFLTSPHLLVRAAAVVLAAAGWASARSWQSYRREAGETERRDREGFARCGFARA